MFLQIYLLDGLIAVAAECTGQQAIQISCFFSRKKVDTKSNNYIYSTTCIVLVLNAHIKTQRLARSLYKTMHLQDV
jgi:hypothetical protein